MSFQRSCTQLDLRRVLSDATNFFTFIDTFNDKCTVAQRGKSKEGRKALRIVGLPSQGQEEAPPSRDDSVEDVGRPTSNLRHPRPQALSLHVGHTVLGEFTMEGQEVAAPAR